MPPRAIARRNKRRSPCWPLPVLWWAHFDRLNFPVDEWADNTDVFVAREATVDNSALDWLVDGRHTLPDERGYFLDRSYRMHPAVRAAVSELCYGGRPRSHAKCIAARSLDAYQPGVRVVPVRHQGNSIESPQEGEAIVAEIQRLLGRSWTDEHGTRPLAAADVLVLAPYNAHVAMLRRRLSSAGLRDVRVGTIDKFQGAQAPVVFISMTASSADEVPRGISFLLNRNRLNAAISRAQYAAVVVRSEMLTG
ncbi:hypothetical protein AWC15_04195 [Mycobacterium lacus]|nr:hypothetical protein AWC15_04195 [Mycobacterium lacus]